MYADFECNLRGVESYEDFTKKKKKLRDHVPCSFAYKVVCVDDGFTKPFVVYRCENAVHKFIKEILQEHKYCRKVMNIDFNKNLTMCEEEEHLFQQSKNCWICKKLIDNDDEKVSYVM